MAAIWQDRGQNETNYLKQQISLLPNLACNSFHIFYHKKWAKSLLAPDGPACTKIKLIFLSLVANEPIPRMTPSSTDVSVPWQIKVCSRNTLFQIKSKSKTAGFKSFAFAYTRRKESLQHQINERRQKNAQQMVSRSLPTDTQNRLYLLIITNIQKWWGFHIYSTSFFFCFWPFYSLMVSLVGGSSLAGMSQRTKFQAQVHNYQFDLICRLALGLLLHLLSFSSIFHLFLPPSLLLCLRVLRVRVLDLLQLEVDLVGLRDRLGPQLLVGLPELGHHGLQLREYYRNRGLYLVSVGQARFLVSMFWSSATAGSSTRLRFANGAWEAGWGAPGASGICWSWGLAAVIAPLLEMQILIILFHAGIIDSEAKQGQSISQQK